jgi:hypothetical protein
LRALATRTAITSRTTGATSPLKATSFLAAHRLIAGHSDVHGVASHSLRAWLRSNVAISTLRAATTIASATCVVACARLIARCRDRLTVFSELRRDNDRVAVLIKIRHRVGASVSTATISRTAEIRIDVAIDFATASALRASAATRACASAKRAGAGGVIRRATETRKLLLLQR